jgi:hypothetical protein
MQNPKNFNEKTLIIGQKKKNTSQTHNIKIQSKKTVITSLATGLRNK